MNWSIASYGLDYESKSSHINKFELQDCNVHSCMKSKGNVGYLSAQGDIISSHDVVLEVFANSRTKFKSYHCDSYRYDFLAKFVLCDNRKLKSVPSVTMDSKFNVTEYKF